MNVGYPEGQEKALDPLELQSQLFMDCTLRILGTELTSSGRTASTPVGPYLLLFKGPAILVSSFVPSVPSKLLTLTT